MFELGVKGISALKERMKKEGRLQMISGLDKQNVMVKQPEPYKSFYSYEIRQQGEINFNPEFKRVKAIPFGPYLSLIACGSSNYAALASLYFFKKLKAFNKISIYDPSEMVEDDISPNETVVMISQSGETKDLINIISDCHKIEGVKTIGIINVEGSTIARKVDYPIYIKVGREVSVAATKSMFHQMLNLIMLAIEVATVKQSAPK